MLFGQKSKIYAWILGITYVVLIGFGQTGVNFQATLFNLLFLFILFLNLRGAKFKLSPLIWFLFAADFLTAVYFGVTTNYLVSFWNQIICFLILWLLILACNKGQFPENATDFFWLSLHEARSIATNFFSWQSIKNFFTTSFSVKNQAKGKANVMIGIFLSFPILVIFHILFSQINASYADFVWRFFKSFYDFLKFLWDINIVQLAIKITITSYWFFIFLSARLHCDEDHREKNILEISEEIAKTVFTLCALLFFLFSAFQSQMLFARFSQSAFKELSLYTQKGFWELLVAAVFGYAICLFTVNNIKTKKLLIIFTLELLLLVVFSSHKLLLLTSWFGFKDQRIMAGFAIFLIGGTFVGFLARLFEKINASALFKIQLIFLVSIICFLNIINVDLFVSKINPVSNFVNGKKYKDYSYILGNSFDNHAAWPGVIIEAFITGAPQPKDYYWGSHYFSLCDYEFRNIGRGQYLPRTYLKDKYNNLVYKYKNLPSKSVGEVIREFNLNEYQAYLTIKNNRQEFKKFLDFAKNQCKK